MKILCFFLFCGSFLPCWIQIRIHILNADPGPATQINADPDPATQIYADPAPRPWIKPQKFYFCLLSQAANQDLDVEVQFVEDITDILNVPDETLFILDQNTATADNNPPDLGSKNPADLAADNPLLSADAGAAEDIHTIEQFLGQPLVIAAVGQERAVEEEEPVMVVTSLEDDQLVIVDDQPSEDIDEIQRFLEGSQPFDDHSREQPVPAGTKDDIKTVVPESSSSSSEVKYKIPKTPEFKKRFQNKEIVKIVKGTDSHHHNKQHGGGEKIRVGGGAAAKAKPAPPSFEDQLHEAELIDIRRISSALGEKKRKWKNKSSTRDYMITKKYAKIVAVDSTPARRADSPVEEAEGRAENR
jgi:hypothetical protein